MANDSDLVFYKLTRSHIEHEDDLLHQRLTWLFAIQAFLFTAYGLSLNPLWYIGGQQIPPPASTLAININSIRFALALTGGLSSFVIWLGLMAALTALMSFANEWERKPIETKSQFPPIAGRRFLGLYGGLLPPLVLPPIFAIAWIYLEIVKKESLYTTESLYIGISILFIASLVLAWRFGASSERRRNR